MARTLSFHATRVEAEAGEQEPASLSFAVEADGDPSTYFNMMVEDADMSEVRVGWGDGKDARDECVLVLSSAILAQGKFKAAFGEPRPSEIGPYGAVEVTFDELEADEAGAVAGALSALAAGLGAKLSISLPGVELGAAKKAPDVPRRHGAPVLGLLSTQQWRVAPGQTVSLALTLSNGGGPLDGGIVVELGGAALEKGFIEPKSVAASGGEGTFERRGNIAVAKVPGVRLQADLEVDRKVDKKAHRPPSLGVTVAVTGVTPGSALFTVRVLAAARNDRSGSAMVGRTLVVAPE